MNKKVQIKDIDMERIANIKHRGSFKEFNLIYKQLNKWVENNNYKMVGNYYLRFDPKYKDLSSNALIFEVGRPVKNRNKEKDLVRIVEIPEHEILSAIYKGPYFNLPSIHGLLEDYARKNEIVPIDFPTEIYLNDPFEVKSNELLTEVQFPVLNHQVEDLQEVPLAKKIERKIIKKQKMAIIEHRGYIEEVYKVRIDLVKWAEKHNIKVDATYFKYYLNPDRVSPGGIVFEVGLPVDDSVKEENNIKIVEIPEHEVLSAVYKGPYVNLTKVHRMIVNYAFENDLEIIDFPKEIYLNSIFDVSCDDLLTEVRIEVTDFKLDKNIHIGKKIEIKKIEKHAIAFIRHKGFFEKISQIKDELFHWIEKNHIKTSGHYFLKFRNHPRSLSPEDIYYDIGIQLDNDMKDFVKIMDFARHKVLSLTHEGSISTLKDTHDFINNYAEENKFIPLSFPVNVFVNKIPENNEDEVLIDVQLPVKGI